MNNLSLGAVVPGLISVIIPTSTVDEWLDEALRSILANDVAALEIIISVNGAKAPPQWWAREDARITILECPDRLGPAGATLRGLEFARGEYYAHLDADDRMSPDRLLLQSEYLRAHPDTVLVGSQVSFVNQHGEITGGFDLPTGADIRTDLVRSNVVPHSAWMCRTEAVQRAGSYVVGMPQMEDYDLLLRLGVLGKIANLDAPLTEYRLHDSQLSRSVLPVGAYVRTILRRRRELAAAIGMRSSTRLRYDAWWISQQWMMYFGRKLKRVMMR